METDWSLLPDGLLVDILSRLNTLRDFFAVRAVCRNWRLVATPYPDSLSSQSPLRLLTRHSSPDKEFLYDVATRRLYPLPLPWTRSDRVAIAYSHGHLITVAVTPLKRNNYNIILWDLFTHNQIRLPYNPNKFKRIILSARPDSGHCLVVLFSHRTKLLQYLRVGDTQWTVVHLPEVTFFNDMMFSGGELIALTRDMEVHAVELMENSLTLRKLGGGQVVTMMGYTKFWLGVVGGMMLTVGTHDLGEEFVVFLWNSETKEWEGVQDLGDEALFVCDFGNAVSISTCGLELRNNYIYSTKNMGLGWTEFSLEDQSSQVVEINNVDLPEDWDTYAIWVFPNYC